MMDAGHQNLVMTLFLFDESFIILSSKRSIEYIFQDFIRCDSTANNFSKEKEIFTYMWVA